MKPKRIIACLLTMLIVLTAAFTVLPEDAAPMMSVSAVSYRQGDSGSSVKTLQTDLISIGYLTASASGSFDKTTQAAVISFQKSYKLETDGIAGPKTLAKLAEVIAAAPRITVTGTTVNVRSGAGTSNQVLGVVKKGEKFVCLGSAKDSAGKTWRILSLNGQTAYISGSYVSYSSGDKIIAPSEVSTSEPTDAATGTSQTSIKAYTEIKVNASPVNIRKGPSKKYAIIAKVKKGAKYVALGRKKVSGVYWYSFTYKNKTAWIDGRYCKISTKTQVITVTTASTTATTTTTAATETTTTQTEPVTSTSVTSTTSSATGESAAATEITSTSTTTTTETTTAQTETSTEASSTSTQPTTAATSDEKITTGVVSVSSTLNVRSGPGTSYSKLGSLKNGAVVTIVSTKSGWYQIVFASGFGWVIDDYIKNVKTASEPSSLAFGKSYYYVNEGKSVSVAIPVSGYTVSYSSADPTGASVSAAGVVKGLKAGLYRITASCGKLSDTCEIVVLREKYTLTEEEKNLKISEEGTEFIADWEGGGSFDSDLGMIVFRPYKDSSGHWTIGYGHAKTTSASKQWSEERAIQEFAKDILNLVGDSIELSADKPYLTKAEASALLNADLNNGSYVSAVRNWAVRNGVKLEQRQFDALVSFCYNLGPAYWNSDTNYFYLKSAIICVRSGNNADRAQVTDGFSRYYRSGTLYLKGLWYRRMNEAEMFTDGDYEIDRAPKFVPPTNVKWS